MNHKGKGEAGSLTPEGWWEGAESQSDVSLANEWMDGWMEGRRRSENSWMK